MRSLYDILPLSLAELTDKNHKVASVFVAALDNIISTCRKKGISTKKVKFGGVQVDGDQVTVSVYYGG